MKTPAFLPLLSAWLALSVGLVHGFAAEEVAPPPAPEASAAAREAPPTDETPAPEPPVQQIPNQVPTTEDEKAQEPAEEASPLRRLDVEEPTAEESAELPSVPAAGQETDRSEDSDRPASRPHGSGDARILFWGNATLGENESADAVVSIIGSSNAAGYVRDAVVSILGSSTSSGEVRGGVVSILGSSRVKSGTVGDVVVSVLGNSYVNGRVRGEVVAVLGNVELGPDAVIDGDLVCVGGAIKRDPQSIVHGEINHVGLGERFDGFEGLHAWIDQCLMYGRPLAFGPNLMWAWWIAIGFLLMYIFIAALFPRPVRSCITTLEQRPGYSLLTALLVTVLTPIAAVLLLLTLIGTPALGVFLLIAGLFGKLVMIAWIGSRLTKFAGDGPLAHPAFSVLVGGIIVLGLYTIPVVGFIVAKLLSWLGLGVVVYTIILAMKRHRAVPPPPIAVSPLASTPLGVPPPVVPTDLASPGVSAGFTGPTTFPLPPAAAANVVPPPLVAPVVVSAATLHRAGFWIRIAASVLDALLIGIAVKLLPNILEPNFLLAYAAYCIVLWALKGTTIGGIVCNLKVVRLNDQPVDWSTALVRALGGFLSLFAAGIGFIWVAFDDQRQSWHDKIAGTTIVHVPKGIPLV